VKMKSLAVFTVVVLGCCAAFAQGSATLGFTSSGDLGLYCNYEQITWGGYNNFYFEGVDNLSQCFTPFGNATIEGVKVGINPSDGAPVLGGPAYAAADSLFDAFSGVYTGAQWFIITQTKPSKLLKHYGWVGYEGFYGYEFLDNFGYLSASIPGNNKSGKPVLGQSNGGAPKATQTKTRMIKSNK